MSEHTLLGYPYSVLRPVIDSWIFTFWPDFGLAFARIVICIVRLPFVRSGSSTKAGTWGLTVWFTMFCATTRHGSTMSSSRQAGDQSRVWSWLFWIRHWTHRFPGVCVVALFCV